MPFVLLEPGQLISLRFIYAITCWRFTIGENLHRIIKQLLDFGHWIVRAVIENDGANSQQPPEIIMGSTSWSKDNVLQPNTRTQWIQKPRKCIMLPFRMPFSNSIQFATIQSKRLSLESTNEDKETVLRFMDFIKTANAYQMVCRRSLFCSLFAVYSCVLV